MRNPPYDVVCRLLRADFETGRLYWLPRPVEFCPSERQAKIFNTLYAGKEAFLVSDGHGYLTSSIFGRAHKAHRVIWLLKTGAWPEADIDHINGDRADNRIANLRAVSRSENLRNMCVRSDNTSGTVGVARVAGSARWQAYIKVDGRKKHLGYFLDIADAIAARKAAEVEYGYHPNHGRAA